MTKNKQPVVTINWKKLAPLLIGIVIGAIASIKFALYIRGGN